MSVDFIRDAEIRELLVKTAEPPDESRVAAILDKAAGARGLDITESLTLLSVTDRSQLERVFAAAREVKQRIYGRRIVIFAPLYISNHCVNDCVYCGYRRSNKEMHRRRLTADEIQAEVRELIRMGHKRLALEVGEHPAECGIDYVTDAMRAIYSAAPADKGIRRINVNIAATTAENYAKLKAAGIGTYILFQETYHEETYRRMHPSGPKSDYDYHTTAMHRAMEGGIDDVGVGVLFGLYDYRYELAALLMHASELETNCGVGPHTVSVPRLRPSSGVDLASYPHLVGDDDFKKLVAVIRLALPYTGMILSTRESADFRDEVLNLGISQISAGSNTGVGGYSGDHEQGDTAQFEVDDVRTPSQVITSLCRSGFIPSYCTACYREGRTGDRFMRMAKSGSIANICQANALLTLNEYLNDFADDEARAIGKRLIETELACVPSELVRDKCRAFLAEIDAGKRDFRF